MAYHRHTAGEHPGYHGAGYDNESKPFLEEKEDKYDSAKYDSKDPFSAGYNKREEEEQKKKELSDFEKQLENEAKPKYDKKDSNEENIKRQAAQQLMSSDSQKNIHIKKKSANTIEEAIEKAIKDEKKVLILDR